MNHMIKLQEREERKKEYDIKKCNFRSQPYLHADKKKLIRRSLKCPLARYRN